jgi:hypothetical protein
MLDDLRNHDATPTDEERAWLEPSALEAALRSAAALMKRATPPFAAASNPVSSPASSR